MSLQLNCKSLLERDESSYEKNLEYNKTLKKSVSTFHLLIRQRGGTMSKKYDRAELLLKSMGVCLFFILLIVIGLVIYL